MKIQILEVHLKSIDQGEGSEWCERMFKEIGSHLKWCKDEVYDVRSVDMNKVRVCHWETRRRSKKKGKKERKMRIKMIKTTITKGVQL